LTSLVDEFPRYEQNLNSKLATFRTSEDSFIRKLQRIGERVNRELAPQTPGGAPVTQASSPVPTIPVQVVQEGNSFQLAKIWAAMSPVMHPLATLSLALVLVVFMLMRREDLRDRVISLVGHGRLTVTTKALDDAGDRISRYLLLQLIVNGTYGLLLAGGLYLIGIPYALVWGFLAGVLRYIPYLGQWIAATLTFALSLLVAQNWTAPLMVLGLFLAFEVILNTFVEPWVYGRGIGVSETGTLIMIAFWTWMWGPIGLVLATPLTVCLVVAGKYVPFLTFFDTLLGDQPALAPEVVFYQRLLARDLDEAEEIAEEYLKHASLLQALDKLLIGALAQSRRDLEREAIAEDERRLLVTAVQELAVELGTLQQNAESDAAEKSSDVPHETAALAGVTAPLISVLGVPARDDADVAGLAMLKNCLPSNGEELALTKPGLLASDVIALVSELQPTVVCIGAVAPGGSGQARLLCLRLRAKFPALKILVGRWGYLGDTSKTLEQLRAAGADELAVTLEETCTQIANLRAAVAPAVPPTPKAVSDVNAIPAAA
jgi:predicted PurR-regulated permease PerM